MLRYLVVWQADSQANSQQHPWSAADHQEHASDGAEHFPAVEREGPGPSRDPFMREEALRRQSAASASAPEAEPAHGPFSHGHEAHMAGRSSENSLSESSYTEDPFMRSEREARGLGNAGKPSQKPSDGRPKAGPTSSRFPRRTVGGEPREIEYDDPFMRNERAARLPPQRPLTPKARSRHLSLSCLTNACCNERFSHDQL